MPSFENLLYRHFGSNTFSISTNQFIDMCREQQMTDFATEKEIADFLLYIGNATSNLQ